MANSKKLKQTIVKLRRKRATEKSDFLIKMENESYRAHFAELKARQLSDEISLLKKQLESFSISGTILPNKSEKITTYPELGDPIDTENSIRYTPRYCEHEEEIPITVEPVEDVSNWENEGGL